MMVWSDNRASQAHADTWTLDNFIGSMALMFWRWQARGFRPWHR